jgi:hypothetical protein
MTMTDTETLWIIVAAAAFVVAALFVVARRHARTRTAELRERFGPEYDRAVTEFGGPRRAERELAARTRRVERIHITDLTDADRSRFMTTWSRLQEQFVDDPSAAAAGAADLIKQVMRGRGYPVDDFDHRAAALSVDHPAVVQHYRAARALEHGDHSTEDLRQAVVHYRVLFADLLGTPTATAQSLREEHA